MGKDVTVHVPVLLAEVLEALNLKAHGTYLDCTVGGAGHMEAMLKSTNDITVIGLDRDQKALERAASRLQPYSAQISLHHMAFGDAKNILDRGPFDGVLADLGTSSDQLAEERGLSFRSDASLDMRMNADDELTAEAVVNTYSPGELSRVLRVGGVRKNLKRFVSAILANRPFSSAKSLGDCIAQATPMRDKKDTHPATVVFQAIRIEVNKEFEQIDSLLNSIPSLIAPKGRFVCISFHSLEDQLVAKRMRRWRGESAPANFPGMEAAGRESLGSLLTSRAVVPSSDEVEVNPRARSARMRVFEFNG